MKRNLNERYLLFCKAYLAGNEFNATKAAIAAGFSKKTARQAGNRLLTNVDIQAYLKKEMDKLNNKLDITIEWKMQMLKDCAEKCMSGHATKEGFIHPSGLVGSLSELNKMQGHYAPEKSINANVTVDPDTEESRNLIKQFQRAY